MSCSRLLDLAFDLAGSAAQKSSIPGKLDGSSDRASRLILEALTVIVLETSVDKIRTGSIGMCRAGRCGIE